MLAFRPIGRLLRDAYSGWSRDEAPRLAAAIAFYTAFSLAPLLVISVAIAAFLLGEEEARERVLAQVRSLVGPEGGRVFGDVIQGARRPGAGIAATLAGVAALFLGASGVFAELQGALNVVWGVKAHARGGLLHRIRDRFLSFTMVVGVGFLLLVSLVISAALETFESSLQARGWNLPLMKSAHAIVSLGVVTILFAAMFRILPDARTRWRDVWPGAALTAILFTAGKRLIGLYLGHSGFASAYGAAASLVLFLAWIYYSSQIFLFGAEFTRAFAARRGRFRGRRGASGRRRGPAGPAGRGAARRTRWPAGPRSAGRSRPSRGR